MNRIPLVSVLSLACLFLVPAAAPQALPSSEEIVQIDASLDEATRLVAKDFDFRFPAIAIFQIFYRDVSVDSATGVAAQSLPFHDVSLELRFNGETPAGWSLDNQFVPTQTRPGQSGSGTFEVKHSLTTSIIEVSGTAMITIRGTSGGQVRTHSQNLTWSVIIAPSPSGQLDIEPGAPEVLSPFERGIVKVRITNQDYYNATFRLSASITPSQEFPEGSVVLLGLGDYHIPARSSRVIALHFVAPREQFWYNEVSTPVIIRSTAIESGADDTAFYQLKVNGFYFSEFILLIIIAFILQVLLVVFLFIFAKRRYERRYLGRPIPPWQIPEEAANLRRLKVDDPSAHYVLRYFLMEEEYRSALNWFFAYKKISRRKLKAEIKAANYRERADALVTAPTEGLDRKFARVERRFERRIEGAKESTLRRLDRLQARLDRSYEKDYDQDHEKWEKKVEKLQAKHDKPFARAHKAWKKETEKVLARWEKPFKREKAKYQAKLEKATDAYEKKVKKQDKEAWKAWRALHKDWVIDAEIRKQEQMKPLPEPKLFSSIAGPPELPEPFVEPPKPELPHEPHPSKLAQLPPEPQLVKPGLDASHYARKAAKVRRKGAKEVRKLEAKMGHELEEVNQARRGARVDLLAKRDRYLEASNATLEPSLTDKILRRTPQQAARRHQVAYVRGLTKQRISEAQEIERTRIDRVRIEGVRKEAELQGQIIREKANLHKFAKTGGAEASRIEVAQRIAMLSTDLDELKRGNVARVTKEEEASKDRLAQRVIEIKKDEQEALKRADDASRAPEVPPDTAHS